MVALPLKALGENLFLAFSVFWWLPAFLVLWSHQPLPLSLHCSSPLCLSLSLMSLCLCLIRVLVMTCRAHPIIQGKLLILRSLIQSHLLPYKIIFIPLLNKALLTGRSFFFSLLPAQPAACFFGLWPILFIWIFGLLFCTLSDSPLRKCVIEQVFVPL